MERDDPSAVAKVLDELRRRREKIEKEFPIGTRPCIYCDATGRQGDNICSHCDGNRWMKI